MRAEALSALRNMKDDWEQIATTSQHGLNMVLPASDRNRYNESVHKLMISGVDLDATDFDIDSPIPTNKKRGRPYDGVSISVLLSRVKDVLRRVDAEQ